MAQQVADLGVLAGRIAVVTGGALHQPPTAPKCTRSSAAGARSSAAVLRPRAHHLTIVTRAVIQVFLARGAKFVSAVKTGSKNALERKLLLEGFSINNLEPFFFRPPKNGPQKYP